MVSLLAEPTEKWCELHDGLSISSTEGERFIYGGETPPQRGRLSFGEGYSLLLMVEHNC